MTLQTSGSTKFIEEISNKYSIDFEFVNSQCDVDHQLKMLQCPDKKFINYEKKRGTSIGKESRNSSQIIKIIK